MKRQVRAFGRAALLILLGALASIPAASQVFPAYLNYQGKLGDPSGNPLTGTYSFEFKLYSQASGGTLLFDDASYTGVANAVSVVNGVYSVQIGSLTAGGIPVSAFFNPEVWLEIHVNAGTSLTGADTLAPRERLTTSPFAFLASNAEHLGAGVAIATFTSGGVMLFPGDVGIGTTSPYTDLEVFDSTMPASGSPPILSLGRALNNFTTGGSLDFEFFWSPSSRYYTQARILSFDTSGYGGNLAFYTKPADGSNSATQGGAGSDTSVERMRIDNNGNVGVGTTAPGGTLELYKNAVSALGPSLVLNNPGGYGATINLDFDGIGTQPINARIQAFDGHNYTYSMVFLTKDPSSGGTLNERMRIDGNTGNLGIGTTTPAYSLDVNGPINGTSVLINGVPVGTGGTQWSNGGGGVISYSGGNVGIGTTGPENLLSVQNGTDIDQGDGNNGLFDNGLATGDGLSFGDESGEGIASKRTAGGNLYGLDFYTSYNDRMSIDNNGDVGIGTSGPGSFVDIATSGGYATRTVTLRDSSQYALNLTSYPGNATAALAIQNDDNSRELWLSPLDSGSGYNAAIFASGSGFDIVTGGGTVGISQDQTGQVGIGYGETMGEALDVQTINGSDTVARFVGTVDPSWIAIDNPDDSATPRIGSSESDLLFRTSGVEQARLQAAGNFQFGTANDGITRTLEFPAIVSRVLSDASAYRLSMEGVGAIRDAIDLDDSGGDLFDITTGSAYTQLFVIDTAGEVGIGQTNPQRLLHIGPGTGAGSNAVVTALLTDNGDTSLSVLDSADNVEGEYWAGDIGGGVLGGAVGTITDNPFQIVTNDTPRIYFDNAGNVGLGISVPVSPFQIENAANVMTEVGTPNNYPLYLHLPLGVDGDATGMAFSVTSSVDDVGAAIVFYRTDTDSEGELRFYTKQSNVENVDPVQAMVISDRGSVGIGTPAPLAPLDVAGSNASAVAGEAIIRNSAPPGNTGQGVLLAFGNDSGVTASSLNGYIQTVTMVGASGASSMQFGLWNGTADNEMMRIMPSGNVGIGTTNPGANLEIAGGAAGSHLRTTQTTAPTAGVGTCSASAGPTVTGTDTDGQITMTASSVAKCVITVTFNTAFGTAPTVVFSGVGLASAITAAPYLNSVAMGGFVIKFNVNAASGTTYTFNYHAIQ